MRRMASAAAAKKWPRLSQLGILSTSTSRRYASCSKGRGLERLPGLLLDQLLRHQPTQFVVDERQKLLGGRGATCSMAERIAGDFVHQDTPYFWGMGYHTF